MMQSLRVCGQDISDQPDVKSKVKCRNITRITFEWSGQFSSVHFKISTVLEELFHYQSHVQTFHILF